jgi:tRNA (pseudouridine54-N1)-methyltransferase
MRTFVLYARGTTDSKFDVCNLPAAGRMDLICRCISSALYLSYSMREDARIFVVLNGPPSPPITICFDGKSSFYTDEKSIASLIKAILSSDIGKEWKKTESCMVARKSFQEVLGELDGNVYVLDETGKNIGKIKDNPIFVLGDNMGIPKNDEKFALRKGEKTSLGKNSYLASSCISILNWMCDKRGI